MPKTFVSLHDGYKTTIKSRDHIYHSDEPLDAGGSDSAATPTEMVMGALGSCIAMTVKMYATRKGWPLEGVEVELDFERFNGKDYPGYAGDEAHVHEIFKAIRFIGDLTEDQNTRLLDIATRCPVHRLLSTPTFWVMGELDEEFPV